MASLSLNFLELTNGDFPVIVFLKPYEDFPLEQEEAQTTFKYRLPFGTDGMENFSVSFFQKDGFTENVFQPTDSIDLTKRFIILKLKEYLSTNDSPYFFDYHESFAENSLDFTIQTFNQGRQIISLTPYFLEEKKKFGFLISFNFRLNKETKFDKEVQKLSFSLDENLRSNKNYYFDIFNQLRLFVKNMAVLFENFQIGSQQNSIATRLTKVQSYQLAKKEYLFNNNNSSHSPFIGIKNFGPYRKIEKEVIFIFIFEDRFRSFANGLYLNLVGKLNPGTFPGMEQMFKIKLGLDNVKQIKINDSTKESLTHAVSEAISIKQQNFDKNVICIYIEDYEQGLNEEASDNYYFLKYQFISHNIPLQVVNYQKLSLKNALKWSVSNIALALFAKLGGIPWIVKSSNKDCLILGIGSSHKRNKQTGVIQKYFAYSVCLDSSGIYKKLEVLADDTDSQHYLQNLKNNLVKLLTSSDFRNYKVCVLHLPFKVKRIEIDAIAKAVKEINNVSFIAIKVNLDNKYFGFSEHNTKVPYEGTSIKLSRKEYLVWFEGLLFGKEIVDKRLSNPVHLKFLRINDQAIIEEQSYIQDVLNLSGTNWRGFNARSTPISIFYAKIVSDYLKVFNDTPGFDEKMISNLNPWFL